MGFYQEHVFPRLIDCSLRIGILEEIRQRVLANATGHVLEVGAGTGANLLYYPDSITSLTTVDPNPGMHRRMRRRIKYVEFPVDARILDGERLPMKNAAFDCAVTTFALCSIRQVERALAEIYRVLKPGARLLFVEHGLSDEPGSQKWQRRLNPLPGLLCDGCRLDRPIADLIRAAGFSLQHVENYQLDGVPRAFGYMYEGIAVR